MIDFRCRCGFQFSLPPEMAGKEIQCPKCGILNDVPKMGELDQFGPDGMYKVDASPVVPDPHQLEELFRTYGRHKTDEEGRPLDLRYPVQSIRPVEPIPVEEPPRVAPRYDPETGELVKPIELAPGPEPINPAAIPLARPMIQYATGENARPSLNPFSPMRLLLHPMNLTVMFFVLVVHALALLILAFPLPEIGVMFFPVAAGGLGLAMAHLTNVVEEIGPEERDELPRFMRDLEFGEDIWLPFIRIALAIILCYLPALIAMNLHLAHGLSTRIALGLAAVGTFLFPATFLTSATSGTVANLRPDRPWRVIGVLGIRYFFIVGLFVVTVVVYAVGLMGVLRIGLPAPLAFLSAFPVNYLILIAGIFLSHYFCWILGLVWRGWHKDFPWVLQYYHARPPVLPSGPPKITAGSGAGRSYTDYRRG
jgi:hypothetical protein